MTIYEVSYKREISFESISQLFAGTQIDNDLSTFVLNQDEFKEWTKIKKKVWTESSIAMC